MNAVDIAVLCCFAVVQPLLGLLARSEALLITHGARASDVVLLAIGVCIVPAGLLILAELAASQIAPRAAGAVHRVVLALLLALTILPIVKRAASIPAAACVAVALALGAIIAVQYMRIRTWRWSAVYLAPAIVLFPCWFVFGSGVSSIVFPSRGPQAARARIGNPVPVVLVVFDEFPLASLLDKDGNVDAALYPNFAALAHAGTWYRNTTTAAESTLISLPAIVDGHYPDPDKPRLPNAAGHPNTLFTLLGGSYRMNVSENNTRLCPEALCGNSDAPLHRRMPGLVRDAAVLWLYSVLPAGMTGRLPDITQAWGNFTNTAPDPTLSDWKQFDELADWHDRAQEFRRFTASIQPSHWPALHFLHILLPHAPWEFLPSGQRYPIGESRIRGLRGTNDRGEDVNRWTGDAWAAAQSYQRHLLQVAFVDRLVGELIHRLRETGLYDRALLVITADHGTSFRPNDSRRVVTPTNHADIMAVPLFIKYPNQKEGGTDDRPAENVDIFPTIADVLKVKPAAPPDGRSLLADAAAGEPPKRLVTDDRRSLRFPGGLGGLFESVKYKFGIFGGGLYSVGDRYGWIGREASAAETAPGIRYKLAREAYYSRVDLKSPMLGSNIAGTVQREAPAGARWSPLQLAVSVNGVIRAVTESYIDGGAEQFWAQVPESALRAGSNEIGVYLIRGGGGKLARIERDMARRYQWGERITLGRSGNAGPFYGAGWSVPEDNLTWTDGHAATLYLPADEPPADLVLRARLGAYTAQGRLEGQRVRVLINGHEITQWLVTAEFEERTAIVRRGYLSGREANEIVFDLPDATAPFTIGGGADARTLGIALMWLEMK
ncbi:MAG: sulfatase-like hydrolase/transferase [Acidobacteriota bacterium]